MPDANNDGPRRIIAVAGATGRLGGLIVAALRAATGRELTRVPVKPDEIVGL